MKRTKKDRVEEQKRFLEFLDDMAHKSIMRCLLYGHEWVQFPGEGPICRCCAMTQEEWNRRTGEQV